MTSTKKTKPTTSVAEPTAPPTSNPAGNVVEALTRVMGQLPGIGRDNRSEQGYSYRGIEQITQHVQRLFSEHGIVFVPKVLDRKTKDFTINNRPWTEEQLTVVYTVYGPGGPEDRIEIGPIVGLGRDNSDKGANKAMTQAFKYALIQTLCIADHKDDADKDQAAVADAVRKPSSDEVAKDQGYDSYVHAQQCFVAYKDAGSQLSEDQVAAHKAWKTARKIGWPPAFMEWEALMGHLEAVSDGEVVDAMTIQEAVDRWKGVEIQPDPSAAVSDETSEVSEDPEGTEDEMIRVVKSHPGFVVLDDEEEEPEPASKG